MKESWIFREQEIGKHIESIRSSLIETRRDIYQNPELSGEERRTANIIANRLCQFGLEVFTNVGGHGVVGLLKGKNEKAVVAWRADIDAFAIQDKLQTSYKSRVPGIKHACGHDVHTTIGLGIAEVLSTMRKDISGSIKFIFQPAEETATGAKEMIRAGVLENPRPEAIFALHVAPLAVGQIGCIQRMALPGNIQFHITINGQSHSNNISDSLITECISTLHSLNTLSEPSTFEEMTELLKMMVNGNSDLAQFVTVGCWLAEKMEDESIIKLQGVIRATTKNKMEETKEQINNTLEKIMQRNSVNYLLEWVNSLPATVNNIRLERDLRKVIERGVGTENVIECKAAYPFGSEDFSLYQQEIPGILYWLGVANLSRGIKGVIHLPDFDVDEECLIIGTKVMSNLLLAYLDEAK